MQRMPGICIEVLRDRETPDVPIDAVLEGLEELKAMVPQIEIAIGGLSKISKRGTEIVRIDKLPYAAIESSFDTQTDLGMIVTSRQLYKPDEILLRPGNIVVAQTYHPKNGKDFTLMDAERALWLKELTMHEGTHLLKAPRGGEYFDGFWHCTHPTCIMQAQCNEALTKHCDSCAEQVVKRAFKFSKRKNRRWTDEDGGV